jgi:Predicted sugar kinase
LSILPAIPAWPREGSGDVRRRGVVGGLMARGYDAIDATALGVWIHGFAGDRLTEERTAEAWSSRDLIDVLPAGFKALY